MASDNKVCCSIIPLEEPYEYEPYEYEPSDDEDISKEDMLKYEKEVAASEGYDVSFYPGFALGLIMPMYEIGDRVPSSAKMAIEKYNEQNHTDFKMVEVVKANTQVVGGFLYYMTFKAMDGNGKIETFQGQVRHCAGEVEFVECRVKPTTTS